ncbi:class I SAM-dependent methyltransferase [Diaphorobacter sp.]|uniref:class I SAM-dependent methyltransferase n=1 Tax=Diaphorobacter sp. TaxID=1934310 RepID=UPI00258A2209|nr:class I SAM-dependent methyltransferase [Diaphorobacter sp.]
MPPLLGSIRNVFWRLSMLGLARGPHITRYSMYRTLAGVPLPARRGSVLSISGSDRLCEVMGIEPTAITKADYPEHNMLDLQFADESFDFVLSDQVLEHVAGDPQRAIDECHRVLKPGGIAIHTTCFINPVHGAPSDYWRFTPAALELLASKHRRILSVGGWGNFEAWLHMRDGLRWIGIPHATWHPLHRAATRNDPEWPIVTWVVAEK